MTNLKLKIHFIFFILSMKKMDWMKAKLQNKLRALNFDSHKT